MTRRWGGLVSGRWVKWALMGTGLATTGCAGAVGAGAAVVLVGAGVLASTCYDRVAITVTDQATGTKLCDAKVTFSEAGSDLEATSCYSAALSTGKYMMRVERKGLLPYEVPVAIDTGNKCRHAVQTIYVALERPSWKRAPRQVTPPAPDVMPAAPVVPLPPAPPAPSVAPPALAPPPAPATPPASAHPPAPAPPASAPAPAVAPAPAATSFPDAP